MAGVIAGAPSILDALGEESSAHFEHFRAGLDAVGIPYRINPRLVRGLDYYNRTVFEWTTERLGAQGTVCAGGRYDGLVAQLGGRPTPAVGFAMGLERLISLMEAAPPPLRAPADVYLVAVGEKAQRAALRLAERLRDATPGLRLLSHCGGGSFKSQFKKADRSGAGYALVLGDGELERGVIGIKPLREGGDQDEVPLEAVPGYLRARL
jgi:histidyl-tRNA synthetase